MLHILVYFTNVGEDKEICEEAMGKRLSGEKLLFHLNFFVVQTFFLDSFQKGGEAMMENVLSNKILIAYLI